MKIQVSSLKSQVSSLKSQVSRLVLCLIVSFPLFFTGCQKDIASFDLSTTSGNVTARSPLTPEMAKEWFESQFGESKKVSPPTSQTTSFTGDSVVGHYYINQTFQITPAWTQSQISTYLAVEPIVIVPVLPIRFLDAKNQLYSLIFYRDTANQISAKLQVYDVTPQYKRANEEHNVSNFSGMMYQICLDGKVQRVIGYENGQFKHHISLRPNNTGRVIATARNRCDEARRSSDPNFWDWLVLSICDGFDNGGGGNDNGYVVSPIPIYLGYAGVGLFNNTGGGNNNNGGGGSSLGGQIDNSFFQTVMIAHIRAEFEANGLLDFFEELRYGDVLVLRNIFKFLKVNNFDIQKTISLRRFLDEGFTFAEFNEIRANADLFKSADPYLNESNFDADSKEYVRAILKNLKDAKELATPTSGFCNKKDLYDYVKNLSVTHKFLEIKCI
jgi:hypothetical protein